METPRDEAVIDQEIGQSIETLRSAWGVAILLMLLTSLVLGAGWWCLLAFPIGMLGHVLSLQILIRKLESKYSNTRIFEKEEVPITAISEESVAKYYDQQVPEWIELELDGKLERKYFSEFATPTKNPGEIEIPPEKGLIHFRGGLYRSQPKSTEAKTN